MPINGEWTDLVTDFMSLTADAISPDIFRKWSAISMIGGALERRVWARAFDRQTFPNLYIILVAAPGIGKQIVDTVRDLMTAVTEPGTKSSNAFYVAPDSVTKASMLDELNDAKRSFVPSKGPIFTYHSLYIASEEFGVLLPDYDKEFISNLNRIFNNPDMPYRERRRTGSVRKLEIELAQLNILAGATPAYFVGTFPEEAWTTGLARRLILIFASEAPFIEMFRAAPDRTAQRSVLLRRLSQIAGLYGQMKWTPDAMQHLADWHLSGLGKGGLPIPSHSKLELYTRSRSMYATKLATISAISRTGELVIEETDTRRAVEWMLEAEALMPDVFRAMAGKSDAQLLEELSRYTFEAWRRGGRAPVRGALLREFLMIRAPHDKIESLLTTADRVEIVVKIAGTDTWLPRPRDQHGVE